jgi:uncharacterized protein (DUF58 family)
MIGPSAELLRFALAAALFAPAAVVLPWTTPLVLTAYATLALLVAADWLRLRRTLPLGAERRLPARVFVGRTAAVAIDIRNRGTDTAHVEIVEEVPRLLRRDDPVFRGVVIPPGEARTVAYDITPAARGDHPIGALHLLRRSRFGLLERRETLPGAVVSAWPDVNRIVRACTPRHRSGRVGIQAARRRGQGSELDALRDYVPGDDTRRIVWGPSARRGHPVVRLDRHERNHTVWIAVDTSRLMGANVGQQTRLDQAVDVALLLADGALGSQDRVGMIAFDRSVHARIGPLRRRSDLGAFVAFTQPLHPRMVEPDYRGLARALLGSLGQRALIFVLSDFTEMEEDVVVASLGLLAKRHRVVLAGLRDPAFARLEVREPGGEDGLALYRRLVVADLLEAREKVVGRLRRAGVDVIDCAAEQISARALDRYLQMRYGPER